MYQTLFEIPIPFTDLRLPVYGFGTMLFLAFLATSWLVGRCCRRDGLDGDRVLDMTVWIFLGGIVGARVLFMALHPDDFDGPMDFLKIWRGGLVFYGGVVSGTLVFLWYTRRFHMPVWRVLDVVSPGLALGIGIGRFGCLLNGCCWGEPSNLPWAITFPAESIPWQDHVSAGLIQEDAARSLAVHPTQVYLALAGWLLLAATLVYYPRRRRAGEVMAILMVGYAITRFAIEFLRGDEKPLFDGLTISQNVSIALLVGGIVLWRWLPPHPPVSANRSESLETKRADRASRLASPTH